MKLKMRYLDRRPGGGPVARAQVLRGFDDPIPVRLTPALPPIFHSYNIYYNIYNHINLFNNNFMQSSHRGRRGGSVCLRIQAWRGAAPLVVDKNERIWKLEIDPGTLPLREPALGRAEAALEG